MIATLRYCCSGSGFKLYLLNSEVTFKKDVAITSKMFFSGVLFVNPLSTNPTKWSSTLKLFVNKSRRIFWVCLSISCSWLFNRWLETRRISLSIQNILTTVSLNLLFGHVTHVWVKLHSVWWPRELSTACNQ